MRRIEEEDLYVFLEVVKQIEPVTILDIGMTLKRAGCLSRSVNGMVIPEDVILDGVDCLPDLDFPVWKNIYNTIFDETVLKSDVVKNEIEKYDLAVLLHVQEFLDGIDAAKFGKKLEQGAEYALMDQTTYEIFENLYSSKCIDLCVGEKKYYLVEFRR